MKFRGIGVLLFVLSFCIPGNRLEAIFPAGGEESGTAEKVVIERDTRLAQEAARHILQEQASSTKGEIPSSATAITTTPYLIMEKGPSSSVSTWFKWIENIIFLIAAGGIFYWAIKTAV